MIINFYDCQDPNGIFKSLTYMHRSYFKATSTARIKQAFFVVVDVVS